MSENTPLFFCAGRYWRNGSRAEEREGVDMDDLDRESIERLSNLQCILDEWLARQKKHLSPQTKLYRYMSKSHFLDLIENHWLTLAHISLWDDPFEGFLFKSESCDDELRLKYAGFYGQSWTFEKRESDILWRAYCPHKDGVRIETTVGKLNDIVRRIIPESICCAHTVLGPIFYLRDKDFDQSTSHILVPHKRTQLAHLLFVKRNLFRSEKEYRVIAHIGHAGYREMPSNSSDLFDRKNGLLKCRILQPISSIVSDAVIDPRMSMADVDRLKCRLVQCDCNLKLKQSNSHHWPKLKLEL